MARLTNNPTVGGQRLQENWVNEPRKGGHATLGLFLGHEWRWQSGGAGGAGSNRPQGGVVRGAMWLYGRNDQYVDDGLSGALGVEGPTRLGCVRILAAFRSWRFKATKARARW